MLTYTITTSLFRGRRSWISTKRIFEKALGGGAILPVFESKDIGRKN